MVNPFASLESRDGWGRSLGIKHESPFEKDVIL